MRKLLFCCLFFQLTFSFAQNKDEQNIRNMLDRQTKDWNRGDIPAFMKGYWENDSLMFIGKNGVTYGYQTTLNNYKKNYPDATAMGQLEFQILQVKPLGNAHYFVLGKWMLKRTIGDLSGHYTLLFKKIKGQWVIVADHSS
ncbi:MAG: nuclear transport factor 2 family protein [Chitinophagaceae bacterium]|nr:nuclear transport factor 2 family protein [Chitinophagaceae bacterium]